MAHGLRYLHHNFSKGSVNVKSSYSICIIFDVTPDLYNIICIILYATYKKKISDHNMCLEIL